MVCLCGRHGEVGDGGGGGCCVMYRDGRVRGVWCGFIVRFLGLWVMAVGDWV